MSRRRLLMNKRERIKRYGGIPVFIDHAAYNQQGNRPINEYGITQHYFIARINGDFPTGTYQYGYTIPNPTNPHDVMGQAFDAIMRYWQTTDPTTENSYDYWGWRATVRSVNLTNPKTQCYTIYIPEASYFFVLDPEGNYLIKGDKV